MEAVCKAKIVEARRAGDDALAAELSEIKQEFKVLARRNGHCIDCGQACSRISKRCRVHARKFRQLKAEGRKAAVKGLVA